MVKIDKDNLENTLGNEPVKKQEISKEQEIGFHQGALNTLVNERNEIIKMVQNIESVMQAHIKRLEELGVKIETKK